MPIPDLGDFAAHQAEERDNMNGAENWLNIGRRPMAWGTSWAPVSQTAPVLKELICPAGQEYYACMNGFRGSATHNPCPSVSTTTVPCTHSTTTTSGHLIISTTTSRPTSTSNALKSISSSICTSSHTGSSTCTSAHPQTTCTSVHSGSDTCTLPHSTSTVCTSSHSGTSTTCTLPHTSSSVHTSSTRAPSTSTICTSSHSGSTTCTLPHSASTICTSSHSGSTTCTLPHSSSTVCTTSHSGSTTCTLPHSSSTICTSTHSGSSTCTLPHSSATICTSTHSGSSTCTLPHSSATICTSSHSGSSTCTSQHATSTLLNKLETSLPSPIHTSSTLPSALACPHANNTIHECSKSASYQIRCQADSNTRSYHKFSVGAGGYAQCFDWCSNDNQCAGFTFVGEDKGDCLFKKTLPSNCYVPKTKSGHITCAKLNHTPPRVARRGLFESADVPDKGTIIGSGLGLFAIVVALLGFIIWLRRRQARKVAVTTIRASRRARPGDYDEPPSPLPLHEDENEVYSIAVPYQDGYKPAGSSAQSAGVQPVPAQHHARQRSIYKNQNGGI